ncbi:indolepyruvate ferredoxin oxidoreductase subunit alpha [Desulfovibrio sp. 86]|uniref:Indolepyruvate oxidoreductase subunit IorA n=1 Tax=uncultured Desulfovibrio sp. TaxID=167968 RepID=A0A212L279_9BACT|nr:indolepyruvate ferredoxin oxidoreductase subunit alpha [Desulfovibrio sp. 86]SCM71652.1 Indolepyruvate oxidoreductase subunit IorA [uncultured Desulfovibrio sp.]VZH33006.1 Indolepyruvate oxidoreductase subunit IorA [Desulfovibrio sp. 86]
MTKKLMSGNEAVARGAFEACCRVAAAYPGTPSTEILENISQYAEINSRWTTNEKVALEVASGASIGGIRALAAMKHVGLNVAADPLLTMGYIGALGGLVIVSADDPGCYSSQNEQDNRLYAPLAKVLMLEPSDSQECLEFTKEAFALSERFDTPVLLRLTTRICHSKSMVAEGTREEIPPIKYERNPAKNAMLPAHSRPRHVVVEQRMRDIEQYGNHCPYNRIERGSDKSIGIITSGVSYLYAKELFGDKAAFLKLGLTNPLPHDLIDSFARSVDKIYVIEEGEPYLETAVKALGHTCHGKDMLPITGELSLHTLREAFFPSTSPEGCEAIAVPGRPPVLCAGCPHRGFFHMIGKKKKKILSCGDIGCYTLGIQQPLNGMDTVVCMGGGFSIALGMAEAMKAAGDTRKIFGVVGDSTFFHSGMTGMVDAIHSNANVCFCVLDNSITAMTGHQENAGTVVDVQGQPATKVDIQSVIEGMGVPRSKITVVDPLDMKAVGEALDEAIATEGFSVIITKRPCVLIRSLRKSIVKAPYSVNIEKCKKCKTCLSVGCPAISMHAEGYSQIDATACIGCGYCMQVCPFGVITRDEEIAQ